MLEVFNRSLTHNLTRGMGTSSCRTNRARPSSGRNILERVHAHHASPYKLDRGCVCAGLLAGVGADEMQITLSFSASVLEDPLVGPSWYASGLRGTEAKEWS